LSFLYGHEKGPEVAATLAREMRAFRGLLHTLPQSHASAIEARQAIEVCLRKVIARTERVASTIERDSMMSEPAITVSVAPADLAQASALSQVSRTLDAPEIIKYRKSAPYLLNFMRHYSLKQLLTNEAEAPSATLRRAIQAARPTMLDDDAIDAYAPLDGRMRAIMDDIFGQRLEQISGTCRATRWTSNSAKAASTASRTTLCDSTWPSARLVS
jgi:hypothetical protein